MSGGGIGKAAGEMMKEMQKAQQEMQQQQEMQKPGGAQSFQDTMQSQATAAQQAGRNVFRIRSPKPIRRSTIEPAYTEVDASGSRSASEIKSAADA